MEAVASTTSLLKCGCAVEVHGHFHLKALRPKRPRRLGCHKVSGMESVASTTLNPKRDSPVRNTEESL